MKNADIETFIGRYEPLYFDPESCPKGFRWRYFGNKDVSKEYYKGLLESHLGINSLNSTNYKAEEEVMKLLAASTFNEIALAWKAGKVVWEDEDIGTINFERGEKYINSLGNPINQKAFANYCEYLIENKKCINEAVKDENWDSAYKLCKEKSPKNIGPVYIINALFFVTGGKAPIYDAFAHKAVRSLMLDIAPCEVYLGGNPGKNETKKVVLMYQEYMTLLKNVFSCTFKGKTKDDMFISRELDRALWVYGHSTKKWKER